MFVYLACAGGASSSMYAMSIFQGTQVYTSLKVTLCDLNEAFKNQKELGDKYELILVYGPIDALRKETLFAFAKLFSVVLVAPQVRYLIPAKKELVSGTPLKVEAMPMKTFGKMLGKDALDDLLNLLIPIDNARGAFSENYYQNFLRDKDFVIWGMGGDGKQRFYQDLKSELTTQNISFTESSFSVEKLFAPESEKTAGFHLYYGVAELATDENLEAILARVDGIFYYKQFHFYQDKLVKKIKKTKVPIFQVKKEQPEVAFNDLVFASLLSEESKL